MTADKNETDLDEIKVMLIDMTRYVNAITQMMSQDYEHLKELNQRVNRLERGSVADWIVTAAAIMAIIVLIVLVATP